MTTQAYRDGFTDGGLDARAGRESAPAPAAPAAYWSGYYDGIEAWRTRHLEAN